MPKTEQQDLDWHKVAEADELPEGRVKTVVAGTKSLALVHFQGKYAAMDNRCPHQGGPLGEGSIEQGAEGKCWLRCPWHGWDFDPLTGMPPGGHEDSGQETFPVENRDDGIYLGIPKEEKRGRTVSDVMVETMINWNVNTVFGMVGHSNLGLAEALRKAEKAGKIRYFGIRHEGAASFACSGYAKISGKPAACFTIAGPGATNLLTGLWDAKVDRAPVLALTGQVQTQVFGTGKFQEIDLSAAFRSVSQFSQTVLPNSQHGELVTLALKNAIVNRDVAHLIFPDEVQVLPADENMKASSPEGRIGAPEISPSPTVLGKATGILDKAKQPMIIVGYGAHQSMEAIIELAEKIDAPIATTFKGKGLISDHHPLAAGVLGRSGTPIASWFMNECDVLLVFGASFSDHTGIEKSKRIIQVDFDRMALGKFHKVDLPIWGEIGVTCEQLNAVAQSKDHGMKKQVAGRWKYWREEKLSRDVDDLGHGISSAYIFHVLSERVPENAVIAVDVGNNTYSFGRYFECKKQSVIMSGYLGSIGFGFPAAMGAWAAVGHERPVVSVSGDGGFGQYLAEFTTAVKYKMNITHFLLHNGQLGKISKEQRAGEWEVWQTSLVNPHFGDYANSCGGLGIRVTNKDELPEAVEKALAFDGPALVEIMSDAELI
jgi:pyruvate oxidase